MSWVTFAQVILLTLWVGGIAATILTIYVATLESKNQAMVKQRRWELQAQAHLSSPLSVPAPWEYMPTEQTGGTIQP